jgi:hypothetical protein
MELRDQTPVNPPVNDSAVLSVYLGSQDKDHDGVPDLDEMPINVVERGTSHWTAF